jgi:hypothetical protein
LTFRANVRREWQASRSLPPWAAGPGAAVGVRPAPPSDVQIPVELILGPVGALALAMLWIQDLRKERDLLKDRLYKLLDKIDVAAKVDSR